MNKARTLWSIEGNLKKRSRKTDRKSRSWPSQGRQQHREREKIKEINVTHFPVVWMLRRCTRKVQK